MRILFVSTRDVCRSAVAERLTRTFLVDELGRAAGTVSPASAGTHAVPGAAIEPAAAAALEGLGGEPAAFRARRLTADLVNAADLTLTMTREQRRAVLELAPRAMFRTFTLLEAADLLRGVDGRALPPAAAPGERARALVAALGAQRATRRRADRAVDDIGDPYGLPLAEHRETGEEIVAALLPLLRTMCTDATARGRTVLSFSRAA